MKQPLDKFTLAYIECALWSSTDNADESGGEPMDKNYSIEDFDPETLNRMIVDCQNFQNGNAPQLESATVSRGYAKRCV